MKKILFFLVLLISLALGLYFYLSPYNWLDIGWDKFPENHTINVWDGVMEIVPWGVMIDMGGTFALIITLLYVLIVGGRNFIAGLKGDPKTYWEDTFK